MRWQRILVGYLETRGWALGCPPECIQHLLVRNNNTLILSHFRRTWLWISGHWATLDFQIGVWHTNYISKRWSRAFATNNGNNSPGDYINTVVLIFFFTVPSDSQQSSAANPLLSVQARLWSSPRTHATSKSIAYKLDQFSLMFSTLSYLGDLVFSLIGFWSINHVCSIHHSFTNNSLPGFCNTHRPSLSLTSSLAP